MSSAHAERLEHLLQSRRAGDRAEIRAALSRLASETDDRAKRGSAGSFDYFLRTLRVLSRVRGPADADLRLNCLANCVVYFYQAGNQTLSLEAANALVALAVLHGDPTWLRKSHSYAAAMNADLGNISDSLLHYSRAIEICKQLQDPDGQAAVLVNTGVAFNYSGLYREAIACFQQAGALTESRTEFGAAVYASSLINLAQSYLYLGEYHEGFKAAQRSIERTPEPTDAGTTVAYSIRSLTYVQLALELGKLHSARERAAASAKFALRSDSSRAHVMAEVANGLCEVHGGDPERGLAVLEGLLAKTPVFSAKTIILVALVKSYDEAARPEQALSHMKALLDLARTNREQAVSVLLSQGQERLSGSLQALELREARLEARIAERHAIAERMQMLERLAITADLKEEQSGEHGYRVGRLAALLAEKFGWSTHKTSVLEDSARLHDIGKIAIPDRILLSSESLQEAERQFMAMHTTIGAELLGKGNSPQLRMAEEIARHHHEWWNGEGYPSKLKGKRIPIHARIVAIADVFDALTHGRPYSPAWPIDKAIDEIKSRKGTQFDPEITEVFLELIAKLRAEHADLDEYLGRAGRNSPFLQARNRIREMLADGRENEKTATMEGNQTRH